MKKILLVLCSALITLSANAQVDSLVNVHQTRLDELETRIQELQQADSKLRQVDTKLLNADAALTHRIDGVDEQIASLRSADEQNAGAIVSTSEVLSQNIQGVSEQAQGDTKKVSDNLFLTIILGVIIALLILAVSICLYLVLRKKNSSAFDKIKSAQDALQEESLKLDEKLVDILDKQMAIQNAAPAQAEPDHSLALKVADEIVRIETNLSRMDASVKGYKQLSASVRRIKENFAANGYEMVDMLGKPYKEGMKVIANFVSDESLKEGEQIISGIIKPQINYNGVMIQTAQITVSQN